ncbi:hypothetical protein T492DRAFT_1015707 [Pavlovales sp. CCMP2436]|nr:hypothetical protein T492DRAFT_1015707 [Pavlovales sp. CCMP2436]
MKAKELKEYITSAGLRFDDCVEITDFRARAQEAAKRHNSGTRVVRSGDDAADDATGSDEGDDESEVDDAELAAAALDDDDDAKAAAKAEAAKAATAKVSAARAAAKERKRVSAAAAAAAPPVAAKKAAKPKPAKKQVVAGGSDAEGDSEDEPLRARGPGFAALLGSDRDGSGSASSEEEEEVSAQAAAAEAAAAADREVSKARDRQRERAKKAQQQRQQQPKPKNADAPSTASAESAVDAAEANGGEPSLKPLTWPKMILAAIVAGAQVHEDGASLKWLKGYIAAVYFGTSAERCVAKVPAWTCPDADGETSLPLGVAAIARPGEVPVWNAQGKFNGSFEQGIGAKGADVKLTEALAAHLLAGAITQHERIKGVYKPAGHLDVAEKAPKPLAAPQPVLSDAERAELRDRAREQVRSMRKERLGDQA